MNTNSFRKNGKKSKRGQLRSFLTPHLSLILRMVINPGEPPAGFETILWSWHCRICVQTFVRKTRASEDRVLRTNFICTQNTAFLLYAKPKSKEVWVRGEDGLAELALPISLGAGSLFCRGAVTKKQINSRRQLLFCHERTFLQAHLKFPRRPPCVQTQNSLYAKHGLPRPLFCVQTFVRKTRVSVRKTRAFACTQNFVRKTWSCQKRIGEIVIEFFCGKPLNTQIIFFARYCEKCDAK